MIKTVIILGTARSGTSMISGIVHHLGIDMNPVDNPSSQNPRGSYEDRNLIRLTTDIMVDERDGKDVSRNVENINVYLKHRMSEGKDWGFKSALTHEIWHHIDKSLFEDLHVICNTRSVLMNTESWLLHLKERYGDTTKKLEDAILHIQKSNTILLELVKQIDCKKLYTCYEEVKINPNKSIEKIAKFIGVGINEGVDNLILPHYSTLT